MAAPPFHRLALIMALCVGVWAWGLAGVVLHLRYHAAPRPLPPAIVDFPYGEMRVGIDPSNAPFAFYEGQTITGLEPQLAQLLAAEMGIPMRIVALGYDGLYDALYTDQADMLISTVIIDPTRTDRVRYTRPYFDNGLMLASSAERPITDWRDLARYRLAVEFGSEADGLARRWARLIGQFDVRPYELPVYALDALRLGAADAALVDAATLALYLRGHPGWQAHEARQTSVPYSIAIRADRANLWIRINDLLGALEASGALQQLRNAWL